MLGIGFPACRTDSPGAGNAGSLDAWNTARAPVGLDRGQLHWPWLLQPINALVLATCLRIERYCYSLSSSCFPPSITYHKNCSASVSTRRNTEMTVCGLPALPGRARPDGATAVVTLTSTTSPIILLASRPSRKTTTARAGALAM